MVYSHKPNPFFQILVHDLNNSLGLTGAIAGYESTKWRNEAMAEHLMEWLPEFALKYSDLIDTHSSTWRERMRHAARLVYQTKNSGQRGEIGEILLHALVRTVFNSEPAISKIFFKSSSNDTVKGFDAVHVVEINGDLQLWLGEAKFYTNYNKAATDVISELSKHVDDQYLRNEFALISGKLDPNWKHYEKVMMLLNKNTSLDQVFSSMRIPVLLTYKSSTIPKYQRATDEFVAEIETEIRNKYKDFSRRNIPKNIAIHLFLVPLEFKQNLITEFDKKLRGQQA